MKFISKFICGFLVTMVFCQPLFVKALDDRKLIKGAKAGILIEANTGKIIFVTDLILCMLKMYTA